jgi:DNA-binding MarR family transcriptional regulator
MASSLSYDLHKLTARLDRAADRILREQEGVSYSRFLALFAIREGAANQRALSEWLGQSEPSTSRMVGVLAHAGLLEATRVSGAGNRRHLRLTKAGAELVDRCGRLLEAQFEELVQRSRVTHASYHRNTRRLLDQLEAEQRTGLGAREATA